MDRAVDEINVEDTEKEIFKQLKIFVIKNFDLDKDGNIKKTANNLKAAQKFSTLKNIILSDAYKAKAGKFIAEFNTVKTLSDDYITLL